MRSPGRSCGASRNRGCILFALGLPVWGCKDTGGLSLADAEIPPQSSDADATPTATDVQTANVGSPCDILTDAGPTQGVFNAQALECPSRVCIKPIVQTGATGTDSTGALCSAPCAQDSDCAGQTRDPANAADTRCESGFACGIPFVKGALCCQKLCICKDFLGPNGLPTPIACQGDAAASCSD